MHKPNEMKHHLNNPHATLVDVRTPEEYRQGYVKGAINVPLDQIEIRLQEVKSMSRPIILYCRSGNRSAIATALLKQNGLAEVYNSGGIDDVISYTL
mgnify:FL=1